MEHESPDSTFITGFFNENLGGLSLILRKDGWSPNRVLKSIVDDSATSSGGSINEIIKKVPDALIEANGGPEP